jgi:hypothetical protein
MLTVNATELVKHGRIAKHPAAGLFRLYLAGRRPTLLLAFDFLAYGEGLFVLLHEDLQAQGHVPARTPQGRTA